MAWNDERPDLMALLNQAETHYGIPPDLLARIAYQECSWRNEVIDGTVKSPAGAVGMMQLMPQFFPNAGQSIVNDISMAAQLLRNLYVRFQDWTVAVAAYNWGGGNVHKRYVEDDNNYRLGNYPPETQKYVTQVFGDVPMQGALV